MENNKSKYIPKTAFVIFNEGAFGGSPKKETNLFLHLAKLYPGRFFFFINYHLYNQLSEIYNELPDEFIRIIDLDKFKNLKKTNNLKQGFYSDHFPDPIVIDRQHTMARKIYWYYKNKSKFYLLYRQIEKLRAELGIEVFYSVFSGVLPLIFYLKNRKRKAAVVFSNCDSWFSDVHADMKKLWYRKYYSFNDALENSDVVDFLSPYIIDGVKRLGVKLNQNSVFLAPCSYSDYSKCSFNEKKTSEIAFCSRLEPDKNPILFLEAAKDLIKKYPDLKFHILGEGTLVNEVENFISANSLSANINFQFHKNPPEIFKNTSIFVSLQTHTNYPSQSVLEAMACGNAIIASDVGDTNLFINKSNGILIKLEKEELIRQIEYLLNNREIMFEMGKKASEYATCNHSIEKYTDYFLNFNSEAYNKVFCYNPP